MVRRPTRSSLDRSSAASDVYKRQDVLIPTILPGGNSGYPYRNLLPVLSPAMAKSVEIEPGAILNANGYNITVSGYGDTWVNNCLLYTSPSPRDRTRSRMPSSA